LAEIGARFCRFAAVACRIDRTADLAVLPRLAVVDGIARGATT
jgi:hypothetical protein